MTSHIPTMPLVGQKKAEFIRDWNIRVHEDDRCAKAAQFTGGWEGAQAVSATTTVLYPHDIFNHRSMPQEAIDAALLSLDYKAIPASQVVAWPGLPQIEVPFLVKPNEAIGTIYIPQQNPDMYFTQLAAWV
jgi:hypothetical protein